MSVKPIPEGHNSVSPYLIVHGVAKVIDLLTQAFDGTELFRMPKPDGTIGHAEVKIGDSVVMLGEASAEFPPMPATVHVYVNDVDAVYRRAVRAGAESVRQPADQFYGDRNAAVKDAGGNCWFISTHKEDLSPEEIERRAQAAAK
jgi:PhnB protein